MNRLPRILAFSPTLFGSLLSLLMLANPAHANTGVTEAPSSTCPATTQVTPFTCTRATPANQGGSAPGRVIEFAQPTDENPPATLEFTEEESDTAVALFGCDCPVCLNSLRALRGMAPVQ